MKLSNFSNSVACSSGSALSKACRLNSPPKRKRMTTEDVGHIVGKAVGLLLAAVECVVRAAERESFHDRARPADVMTEPQRARPLIVKGRGIRNADRFVGDRQERIIQNRVLFRKKKPKRASLISFSLKTCTSDRTKVRLRSLRLSVTGEARLSGSGTDQGQGNSRRRTSRSACSFALSRAIQPGR